MNSNELRISSLFYDGKLFQVGDMVSGKGEFLDTIFAQRFVKYDTGGVITAIKVKVDLVCNSLYLNHGITYTSIGGLGYVFELDGKDHYAFENKNLFVPRTLLEKKQYFTDYYLHAANKEKLDNLVSFLNREFSVDIKLKGIGNTIYRDFRELFDYFFVCLRIRNGEFGALTSNNFSEVMFEAMRNSGCMINRTSDLIYRFTSANSMSTDMKKSFLKL